MAPRGRASQAGPSLAPNTLVIDNGAFTIKAGFASFRADVQSDECHVIPNCIARSRDKKTYIGAQLDQCTDFGEMAFRRPMEKGYLVNWEAEKAIWEHIFFDKNAALKCDPHETNLVLTEAPNCPQALQTACDQIIFEEFEFKSYYRCQAAPLNVFNVTDMSPNRTPKSPLLLIDCGFSHTIVTPVISGRPVPRATRRLDIGGKFLTNYLREIVSLRHYDLRDEPHLLNEIKEDVSYVCTSPEDFSRSLDRVKKSDPSVIVDYVLPDYDKLKRGFARPHDPAAAATKARRMATQAQAEREDVIPLGNERFAVPELLFDPRDIGMREAGIPGAVAQALQEVPASLRVPLLANVRVVGGSSRLPGFGKRLEFELRQWADEDVPLRIEMAEDPIKASWLGAAKMASTQATLKRCAVTKAEYMENGTSWLQRRFARATEY